MHTRVIASSLRGSTAVVKHKHFALHAQQHGPKATAPHGCRHQGLAPSHALGFLEAKAKPFMAARCSGTAPRACCLGNHTSQLFVHVAMAAATPSRLDDAEEAFRAHGAHTHHGHTAGAGTLPWTVA
jgi:hypothetical protein